MAAWLTQRKKVMQLAAGSFSAFETTSVHADFLVLSVFICKTHVLILKPDNVLADHCVPEMISLATNYGISFQAPTNFGRLAFAK